MYTLSKRTGLFVVLLALLVGSACQSRTDTADTEDAPDATTTTVAPQTHTVTISADGSFSPDPISPNPGDTVEFIADGADVVLCVEPESLFGGERFEIPNGSTLPLVVQPEAVRISFAYVAIPGDLTADCSGVRGGEGGGMTGP